MISGLGYSSPPSSSSHPHPPLSSRCLIVMMILIQVRDYLKADYRLECAGPEYDGYHGYALLMILIYPVGIPIFYFVCLATIKNLILGSGGAYGPPFGTTVQMEKDSSKLHIRDTQHIPHLHTPIDNQPSSNSSQIRNHRHN